jgi:hypothetical protein
MVTDEHTIEPTPEEFGETEKLKNNSDSKPKVNGGARPGAGRPKGSMNDSTKTRMVAKQEFISRVAKNANRLFNAQFTKAVGEQFLMVRYTTGSGKDKKTHVDQVTDPELIKQFINDELNGADDDEYYYISTKPIDNMAIQGLLDRAFGRAAEKVTIDGETKHTHELAELSDEDLNGRIERYISRRTKS